MRSYVKNKFSLALVALLLLSLFVPAFVSAQQKRDQSNSPAGTNGSARTGPGIAVPGRRPRRNTSSETAAASQDFSYGLSVVPEHSIDGIRIDYKSVSKSSI